MVTRPGSARASAGVLAAILGIAGQTAAQTEDYPLETAPRPTATEAPLTLSDVLRQRPEASFEPIEVESNGTMPRSGEFRGAQFTVERAHVTNTHPYTMFGEPRPGESLFAILTIVVDNPNDFEIGYRFDEDAFALRTWSGRLLPHVPSPTTYTFAHLGPGDHEEDELAFGAFEADILDGAALLIGHPPDTPTVIPLTAPPLVVDYPAPVELSDRGPIQAGPIAWTIAGGEFSLDRPADVCCPETGDRADEGELFLTLDLEGQVSGSQYGQTTVSSDAIRLVVGGQPMDPFESAGKANVAEGEAYAFSSTWVVPEDDLGLALQVLDGDDVSDTVDVRFARP